MREEYIDELLSAVLLEVQKKYRYMGEVQRLTKELGAGLSSDDKLVASMVLEMRGKELERVSNCDSLIQRFLPGAPEDIQDKVNAALRGKMPADIAGEEENVMWQQIVDTVQATKRIWEQTVEIDKILSHRLAGEDSYYRK
ncbi:MAG: hypothetical protein QM793_10540 [Muricomes sp.]